MVDLVLLSKTNKILATSPSSFSKLAVGMGDIDYVVADCIKNKIKNKIKFNQIVID